MSFSLPIKDLKRIRAGRDIQRKESITSAWLIIFCSCPSKKGKSLKISIFWSSKTKIGVLYFESLRWFGNFCVKLSKREGETRISQSSLFLNPLNSKHFPPTKHHPPFGNPNRSKVAQSIILIQKINPHSSVAKLFPHKRYKNLALPSVFPEFFAER